MRIAVIGWGALPWDRLRLPTAKSWQKGGPRLPLGWIPGPRPVLGIDVARGRDTETQFVASDHGRIDDLLAALCDRDDPGLESVGFVSKKRKASPSKGDAYAGVFETIRQWCETMGFDAAVWRWGNESAVTFH